MAVEYPQSEIIALVARMCVLETARNNLRAQVATLTARKHQLQAMLEVASTAPTAPPLTPHAGEAGVSNPRCHRRRPSKEGSG